LPGWRVALVQTRKALPEVVPPTSARAAGLDRAEAVAVVAQATDGRRGAAAAARPVSPGLVLRGLSEPVIELSEVPVNGRGHDLSAAWDWNPARVLWAWAAGVVASIAPVLLGALSLRRVARGSEPVTDSATLRLARRLAARVGLRRPVRVVRGRGREIPMTWGVFRPVVLLPADSEGWPEGRLATALLHELAHVKRWDCLTQLVSRAACALYWFNPLAWLALARVRAEQEQACDDLALGCGLDRVSYAGHLLAILAGRARGGPRAAVATAMAATSKLGRRLEGILDAGRSRRAPGWRAVGLALAVSSALLLPLAALSPGAGAEVRTGPGADAAPQDAEKPKPGEGAGAAADAGAVGSEVVAKIRELYVKPPDESALRDGVIKGILDALHDPYSAYYDDRKLAELDRNIQGKLTGIGVQLEMKDGLPRVISPMPGSPALKAGLRPGDVIDEVDGKPIRGVELNEVVKRIVGEAGTVVRLKVGHSDGSAEELVVTRGAVTIPSVRGFRYDADGRPDFLLDPGHGIGYVTIGSFGPDTAGELKAALDGLTGRGMKGLILDLRACPGGLMSAAVDTAKLFLSKGTIVTVRGRDGDVKSITAEGAAPAADVPLVVLADGTTSSSAEIVAGSLKGNDRAVVVGSRTLGKGSIQTIVKLKDGGGAIRLTSAYYELPGVGKIDRREGETSWGVDPSDGYYVPVEGKALDDLFRKRRERERVGAPAPAAAGGRVTPESIEADHADPQLAAALKTLIARTTGGAFVRVGLPVAEQAARLKRLEDARKRRQSLLEDLKKVDQELSELGPAPEGRR
jgi:carboxyl-terminal processing protease